MDWFEIPRLQPMERPQESAQFTGPESVEKVSQFVQKYRPKINWAHHEVMRTLVFDGTGHGDGGRELTLEMNDVVVYLHGELVVMPGRMFLPASDELNDSHD